MTSNLVAGVHDTDCRQSCPFASHSRGGKIESNISSVSDLCLAANDDVDSSPALFGRF